MTAGPGEEALRARRAEGLADLRDEVVVRVTGADRIAFLHRMLTCEVKGLPEGGTAPGLFLTTKGKVVAAFLLAVRPDHVLLVAPPAAGGRLRESLTKYVLGEDVVLAEETGVLSLVGPRAPETAAAAGVAGIERTRAGLPAVDFPGGADGLRGTVPPIGREALEILRIENGIPALGAEATEDTLPQECGLTDHVSFTKGCFLGQEPVGRLQARGRTHRGLAGVVLEPGAAVPERGAAILAGEKEAGTVTSACLSPSLGRPVALALLRHEHAGPGTPLGIRAPGGVIPCVAAALPFVQGSQGGHSP